MKYPPIFLLLFHKLFKVDFFNVGAPKLEHMICSEYKVSVRSAAVPGAATSELTSASSPGNGARAAYVWDGGLICTVREVRRTQRRALDVNRILKRSRS
jgi:hypothetical protein